MKKIISAIAVMALLSSLLAACSMPVTHLKRQPEIGSFNKTMRCDPLTEHCY